MMTSIAPVACFGDCTGWVTYESASYVVAILIGALMPRLHYAFVMTIIIALAAFATAVLFRLALFGDAPSWMARTFAVEEPSFWIDRALWLGLLAAFMLAAHGIARLIAFFRKRGALNDVLAPFGAAALVLVGIAGLTYVPSWNAIPITAEDDGAWELERAAYAGNFDEVRRLLASQRNWRSDVLTMTLAEVAYAGAGDELVRNLLARGADVNGRGQRRKSILALAAQAGLAQPVATLLAAGADINAIDDGGQSALHETEFFNPEVRREPQGTDRGAIVDMLVRAGIPVDARDYWRHTPLILNRSGHVEVARTLVAHGADVNAQDSDGSTALMTNDHPKATEMLLAAGANPFLRDLDGRTILDNRDKHGQLKHRDAMLAMVERWIALHPELARRAREEADRVGKSRIPARYEPKFDDVDIVPIGGVVTGDPLYFILIVIVQLAIAFGMAFPLKLMSPSAVPEMA